jgi:MFS transporter, FHS family, L-fucose permease
MSGVIGPSNSANESTFGSREDHAEATSLRGFVFALFFLFGGITSLNDVLIPKLKDLFTLSYAEAMFVQSAFFAAYFVISIPGAAIVRRIGYMRTAVVGLVAMATGCVLFVPASGSGVFAAFLVALFVLASGITIVQVVSNPLISVLGPPRTAHSRLTFAQAFNSLGTTVFPYVGARIILSPLVGVDPTTLTGRALQEFRALESRVISHAYLGLAALLLVVAAAVWGSRNRLKELPSEPGNVLRAFGLLKQPRFGFGALSIFLYVGAEVAIGSLIVNYLTQPSVMGLSQRAAGEHVALYWGGAMLGRFLGAYLLTVFAPGKVLAAAAASVAGLLFVSSHTTGAASGFTLLTIGLFNSIMFPTIFSLACEGLGRRSAEGSGVICVAIVGGAIVPPVTGHVADLVGLRTALVVPAVCYLTILAFGWFARRPHLDVAPATEPILAPPT